MDIKNILTFVGKEVIIDLSDNTKLKGILHQSSIADYFYCMNGHSMYRNVLINIKDIIKINIK